MDAWQVPVLVGEIDAAADDESSVKLRGNNIVGRYRNNPPLCPLYKRTEPSPLRVAILRSLFEEVFNVHSTNVQVIFISPSFKHAFTFERINKGPGKAND